MTELHHETKLHHVIIRGSNSFTLARQGQPVYGKDTNMYTSTWNEVLILSYNIEYTELC